jgi:hypothetical protein
MVYSDTTNRTGIVQLLEDLTSTQSATGSSYPLATKTRDINLAFAEYMMMVVQASGTWQMDDSNHTKYPNAKFNLVSGQQDYSFTEDEQGNKIQDIYRVECKDPNGIWQLLTPYNEMDEETSLSQQETESGTPTRYYKTANGIFLDRTPNYNSTLGIRMYFTRTPDYFLSSDTTKEAGIPDSHHRYLALKPAYWYWLPKDSQRASLYLAELNKLETLMKDYVAQRNKDERNVLKPKYESNK